MKEAVDKEKRPLIKQYQEILKTHAAQPPAAAEVTGAPPAGTAGEEDYNPFAEEDEDRLHCPGEPPPAD